EVELPELGRPGGVRDCLKHGGVAHGRRPAGVDQVQLDLHAHLRRVGLEQALLQHPREDLQRAPYLVPVLGPVLAADLDGLNVTTHEASAHRSKASTQLDTFFTLPQANRWQRAASSASGRENRLSPD